jgi:Domain of Unknown Function (DUF930)
MKAVPAGGCMRAFGLATIATTLAAAMAVAAEGRFERSLKMLAPAERLEQLCDYTAMSRIREQSKDYRPDRAVANAMAEPVATDDTLEVSGGAFRSRKKWYALSYRCTATPDHLTIMKFRFTIGEEIPESKWASYGLWE